MNEKELYGRIINKYPQYKDIPQQELMPKIYEKYPQYQNNLEKEKSSFVKKAESMLPEAGQVVGGVLSSPGGPFGSALGATAGRAIGEVAEKAGLSRTGEAGMTGISSVLPQMMPGKQSVRDIGRATIAGGVPSAVGAAQKENGELGKMSKEIGQAAIFEAAMVPIFGAASGFAKGVMKGMLGKRSAERGFERGFNKLLDPEYAVKGVPVRLKKSMGSFFSKAKNVAGSKVGEAIKKAKNTIPLQPIKNQVIELRNSYLPKGMTFEDFGIPKAQGYWIDKINKMVTRQGGMTRRAETLWKLRRTIDNLMYNKRWHPDAKAYLRDLRKILNDPIKNSGDDVARSFDRYSSIMNSMDDLEKHFDVSFGPEGQMFSEKMEKFAGNLLKTNNDELIDRLLSIDAILNSNDRIFNEFLDYAAAEGAQKGIGFGPIQSGILEGLGGRKRVMEIGAAAQTPSAKTAAMTARRLAPVGAEKALVPEGWHDSGGNDPNGELLPDYITKTSEAKKYLIENQNMSERDAILYIKKYMES